MGTPQASPDRKPYYTTSWVCCRSLMGWDIILCELLVALYGSLILVRITAFLSTSSRMDGEDGCDQDVARDDRLGASGS